MAPNVFISYSWTSAGHQAQVRQWAERLLADGIDVVLDIYDLKEGHDKYAFMERMVTDSNVTHVLMFCDKCYAEKADARKAGVGTESQIISKEVYEKVDQSKFIPILSELDADGNPYLPAFLKSRIWIDFSTAESVNENWEQLVRLLHGKPLHQKPELGKAPGYLQEQAVPASPAIAKFSALKQAIISNKPLIRFYRQEFLTACIQYADSLRVRNKPETQNLAEQIFADCGKLKLVRDHIVDWVMLETSVSPQADFQESLINFLEEMLKLKGRPVELNSWSDSWFEAHSLFVYETFLYVVGSLLKTGALNILHEVVTSHYMRPESEQYRNGEFENFGCFYAHSDTLGTVLSPPGQTLYSPAAELIKRQADRKDVPFDAVMEADLLLLLMAFITPSVNWYPQTLHYASGKSFPFFLRATQHKGFEKLAIITGIGDADKLRSAAHEGRTRLSVDRWHHFRRHDHSFSQAMNLTRLDTLK